MKEKRFEGGRRGLVVYALDCGEGGPRFKSRARQQNLFFSFKRNSRTIVTPAVPGEIVGSNQHAPNKEYTRGSIQVICTSLTMTRFEQASWLFYPRHDGKQFLFL